MRRRPVFAPLALTLISLSGCGEAVNTNSVSLNANANSNANTNTGFDVRPTPAATPVVRIDEILGRMQVGEIAFNVPPSMRLHEAETIVLLLRPQETAQQAAQELEKELRAAGAAGDIKQATIKIAETMQATLAGDGFQIDPITPDTLPISAQQTTQWKWDVRPLRGGELHLHVVLNALVDLDGKGARPYPLRTFSQTYVVEVPWRDGPVATFLKNNWPWLWAMVLIPGAVLLWGRRRAPRRAARPSSFRGAGGGIFISYRRSDAAGHVGRLHDALAAHFGPDRVFRDLESIGYGEDFVAAIEKAVGSSAVVVVVIGRQWLDAANRNGQRRLDDPRDFVRLEIASALARGVQLIPALVEGATMPGEEALPAPLAPLARRNAIELSDSRWQFDVGRLVEAIEEQLAIRVAPAPQPGA